MDNRPVNLFVKNIEGNGRKVFSSSSKDHGANRSLRKNCTVGKIKEEEAGDEIQEYAATTMSELLGWYGYDKVDSTCTRTLNLDHFTSMHNGSPTSVNTSNSFFGVSSIPVSYSTNSLMSISRQLLSPSLSLKKVSLDPVHKFSYKNYSTPPCSDNTCCSWCGRVPRIVESERSDSLSYNMLNTLGRFCSEACIAAGRRAAFKQVKTCDWCRHTRSPISYVDFQDGESQLQFCSDKCLNQYKMNIFCHETQTHLMLQGLNNASFHDTEKSGLITPELWFRSCQSPLNGSTEDACLTDECVTSNLLSCPYDDRTTEIERNNTEKLVESNQRVCRKKDPIKMKKHTKMNHCNKRKGNFCTEINEHVKEPFLVNGENKFYDSADNETYCRVSCLEKNDLKCKNFKKECDTIDVTNNNSQNRQKDDTFSEKSIHVRNIKDLQDKEQYNLSENILQSSSWLAHSTAPVTHHDIPILSKSRETKYQKENNITSKSSSPKEFDQARSLNSLSTTLLPPVAVLVPYPIPIPIPILVPISTAIFSKLMTDKEESMCTKDSNCQNTEYKDSPNNTRTGNQNATSDKLYFLSAVSDNDSSHVEPLRKKKRSNNVNYENEKI
ncbi:Sine oculis-binding protein homolog [Anthophora plagiata]